MSEKFEGQIPSAAEKEKRGRKIQMPISEAYVQELISKGKITPQLAAQLPNQSVVDYILKTFPNEQVNIPPAN